ncbi:MAG: archaemetzincin [Phycisphaerae bacterium]|nr:archaemetzincin [Phycisphaerae bacterium]
MPMRNNTSKRKIRLSIMVVLGAALLGGVLVMRSYTEPEKHPPGKSYSAVSLRKTIKALAPLHEKLGKPKPGDWLERFDEPGQSFAQYLRCRPITPTKKRTTIYILPIGKFTKTQDKVLRQTAEFMGLYYCVPVKLLDPVADKLIPANARRTHPSWGMKQFLSPYILSKVLRPRLPKDGLVLFGITATDLWPGKGWNFVYGQASLRHRVGVQSIYRNGKPDDGPAAYRQFLRRTLKTATHEMGHVLSMLHCTAYECNMCGSNNRQESDRHPMWMCPQCLAKLCWAVRADPKMRFKKLAAFYKKAGFKAEQNFCEKSYKALGGKDDKTGENTDKKPPTPRGKPKNEPGKSARKSS